VRLCILAFDGLDLPLVARLGLRNLLQVEHRVIRHEEVFNTVQIWSSFITGLHPRELGISLSDYQPGARIPQGLETIFDLTESRALWIPGLNPHPKYWDRYAISRLLNYATNPHPDHERFLWEFAFSLYVGQRELLLQVLEESWNLLMAHFWSADYLGHAFFLTNPSKLGGLYEDMDCLVGRVRKKCPDAIVMVVSDHGMAPEPRTFDDLADHSREGFYSLSRPLNLGVSRFMDFKGVIEKILSM